MASDDCITSDQIRSMQERVGRTGASTAAVDVAERETCLGAYMLCSAAHIADTARLAGANQRLVYWLENEVLARMVVCVEAQRQAQYELWRDLMGDPADSSEPNGDNNV